MIGAGNDKQVYLVRVCHLPHTLIFGLAVQALYGENSTAAPPLRGPEVLKQWVPR